MIAESYDSAIILKMPTLCVARLAHGKRPPVPAAAEA